MTTPGKNRDGVRVTVLMPVFNGELYLREAIDSILGQTFPDFELLIVNDGSTDGSMAIAESYDDSRIRLVQNESNRGYIYSMNLGLDLAQTDYVARLDCDDISLPERLRKQVEFLDANPDVGLVGTWVEAFGRNGATIFKYPTESNHLRARLLFECPFAHSAVMMRTSQIDAHGLRYREDTPYVGDRRLWQELSHHSPVANLGEVLVMYRIHGSNISRVNRKTLLENARTIDAANLADLGVPPTAHETAIHRKLGSYDFTPSREFVEESEAWLLKIQEANADTGLYPEPAFSEELGRRWFQLCTTVTGLGPWVLRRYRASALRSSWSPSAQLYTRFVVKCGLRYG